MVTNYARLNELALKHMDADEAAAALPNNVTCRLQSLTFDKCDLWRAAKLLRGCTELQHLSLDISWSTDDELPRVLPNLARLTGLRSLAIRSDKRAPWLDRKSEICFRLPSGEPVRLPPVLHPLDEALRQLTQLTRLCLNCELGDPIRVKRKTLARLTQLQELELVGGCVDTADLALLTGLRSLNLNPFTQGDLADLAALTALTRVTVWQDSNNLHSMVYPLDVSGVSTLTSLVDLAIFMFAPWKTYTPWLAPLTGLRLLKLGRKCYASDAEGGLEALLSLPWASQLQQLEMGGCWGVSSLVPLEPLQQLRQLELDACDQVSCLAPLMQLQQLRQLELVCVWRGNVSSLDPLGSLQQLQVLELINCHTSLISLQPLSTLGCLERLHVSFGRDGGKHPDDVYDPRLRDCVSSIYRRGLQGVLSPLALLHEVFAEEEIDRRSVATIKPLKYLTRLRELHLEGIQDPDLAPLSGLTQLQELHLCNNFVATEVTALSGLTQLSRLGLRGCWHISSLQPLQDLTRLTQLQLISCYHVRDLTPLAGMRLLQDLNISYCPRVVNVDVLRSISRLRRLNVKECPGISGGQLQRLTQLRYLEYWEAHAEMCDVVF